MRKKTEKEPTGKGPGVTEPQEGLSACGMTELSSWAEAVYSRNGEGREGRETERAKLECHLPQQENQHLFYHKSPAVKTIYNTSCTDRATQTFKTWEKATVFTKQEGSSAGDVVQAILGVPESRSLACNQALDHPLLGYYRQLQGLCAFQDCVWAGCVCHHHIKHTQTNICGNRT